MRGSGKHGRSGSFWVLCGRSLHQLAFLLLSLTHVCLQVCSLAEDGVRRYWRKPGNWLQVATAVLCREESRDSHVRTWTRSCLCPG